MLIETLSSRGRPGRAWLDSLSYIVRNHSPVSCNTEKPGEATVSPLPPRSPHPATRGQGSRREENRAEIREYSLSPLPSPCPLIHRITSFLLPASWDGSDRILGHNVGSFLLQECCARSQRDRVGAAVSARRLRRQGEETRITAAFSIRLRVDHSITWLVVAPPGQPALTPRHNVFVSS